MSELDELVARPSALCAGVTTMSGSMAYAADTLSQLFRGWQP